jgi:hypothetical protein
LIIAVGGTVPRQLKHAITGVIYELTADGNVMLSKDGLTAIYDPEGRFIEGDIRDVDPELCRWVGLGPKVRGNVSDNRRYKDAAAIIERLRETL